MSLVSRSSTSSAAGADVAQPSAELTALAERVKQLLATHKQLVERRDAAAAAMRSAAREQEAAEERRCAILRAAGDIPGLADCEQQLITLRDRARGAAALLRELQPKADELAREIVDIRDQLHKRLVLELEPIRELALARYREAAAALVAAAQIVRSLDRGLGPATGKLVGLKVPDPVQPIDLAAGLPSEQALAPTRSWAHLAVTLWAAGAVEVSIAPPPPCS